MFRKRPIFFLSGPETGPPRHRRQLQGDEHHELVRQRSLRAYRCRGFQIGPLQQEVHHHLPGDPNRRAVSKLTKHAVSEGTEADSCHKIKGLF